MAAGLFTWRGPESCANAGYGWESVSRGVFADAALEKWIEMEEGGERESIFLGSYHITRTS